MQRRNRWLATAGLLLILATLADAQPPAKSYSSAQGTVTVMPAGWLATWANFPVVYVYACPVEVSESVLVQITSVDGDSLTVVLPPLGGNCFAGGAAIGLDAVSYAQILPEVYEHQQPNREKRGK